MKYSNEIVIGEIACVIMNILSRRLYGSSAVRTTII